MQTEKSEGKTRRLFDWRLRLVGNSGLPSESLIEVGTEHRLADEESLGEMLEAVDGVVD